MGEFCFNPFNLKNVPLFIPQWRSILAIPSQNLAGMLLHNSEDKSISCLYSANYNQFTESMVFYYCYSSLFRDLNIKYLSLF